MEPETSLPLTQPTSPSFTPKKPPKLLYLVAGLAIILVSLALGIVFFGRSKSSTSSSSSTASQSGEQQLSAWPKYTNTSAFYEIALPVSWVSITRSPALGSDALFNADNLATLEIKGVKDMSNSIDEFLSTQDAATKDSIKSTKTTQVKVGEYDGLERAESWPKAGLQSLATYIKIQDMVYLFVLSPSSGKNAITSESLIRDYHTLLSSFRLTDTSQLGQGLKEYTSKKLDSLAFSAFSLQYPQTWVLSETMGDSSLDVSIYRNNYELTISQKAIGGAVCLFSDSPSFEGSSGDLRSKQFAEFSTSTGTVLRRYFAINSGDKSSMYFCQKQESGPYFETPLSIGGLVYNVPAKYDPDIIKEMDEIVKSITLVLP